MLRRKLQTAVGPGSTYSPSCQSSSGELKRGIMRSGHPPGYRQGCTSKRKGKEEEEGREGEKKGGKGGREREREERRKIGWFLGNI